jgi:hypothetical protein
MQVMVIVRFYHVQALRPEILEIMNVKRLLVQKFIRLEILLVKIVNYFLVC